MGNVERSTEKVRVTLVDGSEQEVLLYKSLPFRKSQQLKNKLFEGVNIKAGQSENDIEVPVENTNAVLEEFAEAMWADKNYSLEDIEGNSLAGALMPRMNRFLAPAGFKAEAEDSSGGGQKAGQ